MSRANYIAQCEMRSATLYHAVLDAAVVEARTMGLQRIRRDTVARRAGVAAGTVNNAFGNMSGLREAVMREAVSKEHLDIVAQGLALRDPIAMEAPHILKVRALAHPLA